MTCEDRQPIPPPHDLWVHRPRPMTLSLCNFTPEGSSQSNTVLTQIAQYCLEMEKVSLPVRLEVFVGTTPKSSFSERSVELLSVNTTEWNQDTACL